MKAVQFTSILSTLAIVMAMLAGCGGSTSSASSAASGSSSEGTSGSSSESSSESADGETAASSDSIVTVAYTTAWDSLMPYNSSSGSMYTMEVVDKIYDRLAYAEIGASAFQPRAASSWESADDNMSIIFHLDENATWSDGEPVTAADWIYTFTLISDPNFTGTSRGPMKNIAGTDDTGTAVEGEELGVEALDDYTLKIHLKVASSPEDWLLANNRATVVLPEHCLKDIPLDSILTDEFWTNPVGSGPLQFESEVIGSELVLASRPEYQLGAPGFGKMVCTVMDSSNTMNAIIAGDIDMVCLGNSVSTSNVELAESSGLTVKQNDLPTSFTEMIINNTNITDAKLRQALWYALDIDTITSLMTDGYGIPAYTYIMPGSEYENTDSAAHYDPDYARQLLEESSYNGETYTIACGSSREALVSLIQQYFDDIGFNMEIALVDVATMFAGCQDGTYDFGVSGHTATASPVWFDNATSFHIIGGTSYFQVTDPTYTEMFEKINSLFDETEKIEATKEYQAYIAEQTPFIPLWFQAGLYIESDTVSGVDYGAAGMCNDNVWDWVKE